MERVDCVVVGAGVVGLAVGRALALGGREVLVLEQGPGIGQETSSRNSEVIHAGIYYQPGSLKARLCVRGKEQLYTYCRERGIAHRRCGKIIVGTRPEHQAVLERYSATAAENGVLDLSMLDRSAIRDMEPEVDAVVGVLSPSSGIVDSHALMLSLQGDIENAGGAVLLHTPVLGGRPGADGLELEIGGAEPMRLGCRTLVNAAGLGAQDLALKVGAAPENVPTRYLAIGHYYVLSGRSPFHRLVYPIPEDGGLGVHVTVDLGGQAKFGPDVRWIDKADYAFDDSRRGQFVEAIRNYYPGLDENRLQPGYTGIRPKLSGPGAGFSDFRIDFPQSTGVPGLVSLYGMESPGLTSCLAIGDYVAQGVATSQTDLA
ncbi:NAD(P)/FAD-dependent oxidoreductase [Indioceanicola profundi]|uniref:NAD(P)/FAD-dependent oxidoreductase n=1 Tax=Indioceanicola profundi TaxID=2220096 RepID=UPI000E6ACA0B|nr:NAD(P)/FAD-dependent oxidoreductase [Indioceanicola profundi]